jgi:hypothetical protein
MGAPTHASRLFGEGVGDIASNVEVFLAIGRDQVPES